MQGKSISEQILLDCKSQVDKIMQSARDIVSKDNEQFEEYKKGVIQENKDRLEEKSKDVTDKYLSKAKQDGERLLYSEQVATSHMLKQCAQKALNELPHKTKLAFVNAILVKNAEENDKVLVKIDGIKIKEVENLDISKKLSLSIEEGLVDGLMLVSKSSDKNFTFSQLISEAFLSHEEEIYSLLFS